MAGIVGYGAFIPRLRIKAEEIARQWDKDPESIRRGLLLEEKSVPGFDEDTITIAVAAGRAALDRAGIDPSRVGALYIGSESHPYAVKPSGTVVIEALGIGPEVHVADFEFACKAGTSAIILVAGLIEAGLIDCGLAIGADVAQAKPGDALEFTAGAGAGAYILGNKKFHWLAKLNQVGSFTSDTPDFWRRQGENYPRHAGRFTAGPAYFKHVVGATEKFLRQTKTKISDYDHVVLHMPNAKFPSRAAKILGVSESQLKTGFLVPQIGNPYSASSLLGLVAVLEKAKKQEKVLVTSYGSGAGSDNLSLTKL